MIFKILLLAFSLIIISFNALFAQISEGKASYYADAFDGRKTASGEIFDQDKMTAAHRTLPFGTMVKVTNTSNGLSVVVRINDRGPFNPGRILDVSKAAAIKIQMVQSGIVNISMEVINDEIYADKDPVVNEQNDSKFDTIIITVVPDIVIEEVVIPDIPVNNFNIYADRDTISGFTLQIGAYTKLENAKSMSDIIKNKGFTDFHIYRPDDENDIFFRVLYGNFNTRETAEITRQKLIDAGYHSIILSPAAK